MNKSTIVLIIFVSLVVILAGVAGYFFFLSPEGLPFGLENTPTEEGEESEPFSFSNLFGNKNNEPDNADNSDFEVVEVSDDGDVIEHKPIIPQFRNISLAPTSASIFVTLESGELVTRYIERETGHVFDAYSTSTRVERVSNTTIPKIQIAGWINDEHVFIQYLQDDYETVETFVATLMPPEASSTPIIEEDEHVDENIGSLSGFFLPQNVFSVTGSPDDNSIFYLQDTDNGVSGFSTQLDIFSPVEVFSSDLKELSFSWEQGTSGILTTKPSGSVPGYAFSLDTGTGNTSLVLGDLFGMTLTQHPQNNSALVSYVDGGNVVLSSYNFDTESFVEFPSLSTLTDKCLWSNVHSEYVYCSIPNELFNDLPDSWYMGRVSFDDMFWKINIETGASERVLDPDDFTSQKFDFTQMEISENEDYVVLTNKKDLTLWLLRLSEEE